MLSDFHSNFRYANAPFYLVPCIGLVIYGTQVSKFEARAYNLRRSVTLDDHLAVTILADHRHLTMAFDVQNSFREVLCLLTANITVNDNFSNPSLTGVITLFFLYKDQ